MSAALIDKLRAAREFWVEVEPGKKVRLTRPTEADVLSLFREVDGRRSLVVELADVQRFATGWAGITEADLLGADIGSADNAPFSSVLWAEVVADRLEWSSKCARALVDAVHDHFAKAQAATKNSDPTSTPAPGSGGKASKSRR